MAGTAADDLLALLQRALSGQPSAWDEFFGRLRKFVHAEVRKVLGPDADGPLEHSAVVQSVLRRVWRSIAGQFPADPAHADLRRFLAWVGTIARNRSRDQLKGLHRIPTVPCGSAVQDVADPGATGAAARRDAVAVELAAALAGLPERKRQVIELFWFERLSDADIGARLGCSVGAVKVLRCRALRSLRTPRLRALLEDAHDGRC